MEIFNFEEPILEPVRATRYSAGYDLRAKQAYVINPGQTIIVGTGVTIDHTSKDWFFLRDGHFFGLYIRSSAAKSGLRLTNGVGVVDMDYPDEIGVMITNDSSAPISIIKHDRIAQLVLSKCLMHGTSEAERRSGGFGSTGIK